MAGGKKSSGREDLLHSPEHNCKWLFKCGKQRHANKNAKYHYYFRSISGMEKSKKGELTLTVPCPNK